MTKPFVNITMLVHNRPELTEQAIRSLYANTPRGTFTFLVVDDASDDATNELLFLMAQELGFPVVRNTESLGVGGSRNRSIEESEKEFGRGTYLYLSDNDVYFKEGWLNGLLKAYAAIQIGHPLHPISKIDILAGYCHPFSGTNQAIESAMAGRELHTKDALGGISWFLSWEVWDRYGKLMDNARGVCQSEDWEYCQRINKAGRLVAAVHPPVIINTGRTNSFGKPSPGAEVASPLVEGVIVK